MHARRSSTRTTRGGTVRRRRGRVPALLAALSLVGAGLVTTSLTAVTPSAVAAPGNPGVPGEPTVLFVEDFENRDADSNVLLTDYTGADGTTYAADPFWVDRAACNGFIVNYSSPRVVGDCVGQGGEAGGIGVYNSLMSLPYTLGTINGTDPASNAAASSYTSGNTTPNEIQFRTADPLTLPTAGRFVTFSVDAVAQNCTSTHPELRFYLVDGSGEEIAVSNAAIDPCTDPRGAQYNAPAQDGTPRVVIGGRFPADGSNLVTGGSFGIVMRNENGSGQGNDGAYDNIRVLDVTPQLDKEFSPTSVATGGVSTLTLTITNTNDLAAKNGWSFTDTLPEGLVVADPAAVGTDCPAGDVTAEAGATSLSGTGNLDAGMASCTISVNVTSDEAGSYTNGPDNISAIGLDYPDPSTVTFGDPSLELVKTAGEPVDVNENGITDTGDTIAYTFEVTNTGDVAIDDLAIDDPKVGAITCEATSVEPGDSVTCATDEPYVVTDEDVEAGSVDNSATATGTPPGTDTPIGSPPSETTTPTEAPDPAIEVVKSATPSGPETFTVGQEITYSFEVTNTGNVPLSDVEVDETEFSGTGEAPVATCPADVVLAPGDSLTCTASYTLTQEDVDSGEVTNSATATGTPPGDTPPPESPPSTVVVPTPPAPGIEVVKTSDTEEISEVGQEVTYSFEVTNTGNVTLTDVTVDDSDFSGSGELSAVDCPAEAAGLAPGASVTCTATYEVTQADLDSTGLTNTATATGTPPGDTPPPESPPSTIEIPSTPAPGIEVVKTSDTDKITKVGQKVTYSFEVTNTGNVVLTDITVDDSDFSGSGELSPVDCPAEAARLAPGASVTCTATYLVTEADLESGELSNTATATGTPPGGTPPPTSPPSTVDVPVDPVPSAPAQPDRPGGSLAATGADLGWTAGLAALLFLTGAATLFVVRRRTVS
ncbi:hypothetical protein ACH47X_01180 [Promicromonospora kroppenstedtii]|uniref:Uncharacterized protein n=1 Tax=Promicromonospora kroppenstedtii TaxID=440482 RepID=A0ABW7XDC7_9MICO